MSQTKAQLLNPQGDFTLTGQLIGVGATFSGNVSIAGTLTKQDVTNVDSVGVITARSDIIVGGNIAHLGDTDTKIAFTNNQIDFQANNSSRLYVNQYATYLQTAYPLAFLSSSGASPSIKSGGTNNQDLLLTTGTDNPTRLHIQSDGKIGIGTNSASALLHIEGTQTGLQIERNAQTLKIDANHGNGGDQALTASSALRIYTNGANERARFDSNGNLGIGSQIPAGKLDISHDTQTNLLVLKRNTGNTGTFSVAIGGATPGIEFSATGVSDDFVLKPGGTERIRLGSSGQIGIAGANYGNAGQVLTSGGSGSIVSWADAAGGAEYAGIASGAISTGDPVMVHPDGKLAKVGLSWSQSLSPSPAGNTDIDQPGSSAVSEYVLPIWNRQSDGTFPSGSTPVVSMFYKANSGSYPSYRTFEVTGGTTLTWKYSSGFNNGDAIGEFDVAWSPDVGGVAGGGRAMLTYANPGGDGGKPYAQILRGPYSNGVWTQGTPLRLDNNSTSQAHGIAFHESDKFLVTYSQNGTHWAVVVSITAGNNGTTAVAGTRVQIETGLSTLTAQSHVTEKDSNGKHIIFYTTGIAGSRYGMRYVVASISGTTVTLGTPAWMGGNSDQSYEISKNFLRTSLDTDQNRYNVVYEVYNNSNGGSTIDKAKARNAVISGTSVTWSAEAQVSTNSPKNGLDTVYDTKLKKHFVYIPDESQNEVLYVLVSFTGSAVPTPYPALGGTQTNVFVGSFAMEGVGIDYDATTSTILAGMYKNNDGKGLAAMATRTAVSETNLTNTNFIGLSKSNYTDGNTAKVLTSGGIDENQSSLAIGQQYFVQKDGTIATTKDSLTAYAGQAVSSTNLLIASNTVPGSQEGILGYWEWGLCESAFKPWCHCGCFIGAYDGGSSGCNFCMGKWFPQACRYGDHNTGLDFTENIPDSAGGNMCACCGGYCCNSLGTCCCSWNSNCGDGRFGFPSTGLYCYNLEFLWAFNSCRAQGGCMTMQMYYAAKKCRNTACDTWYCPVNGYAFNLNHCNFCDSRYEIHNVRMSGKLPVADTSINVMSFRMHSSGVQNQLCSEGIMNWGNQYNYQYGCYSSKVSFTKISNNPGYFYC